jgi:hypothetical protein
VKCDLCWSGEGDTYVHHAGWFRARGPTRLDIRSLGPKWAVCHGCHVLVREGRFANLLERAISTYEVSRECQLRLSLAWSEEQRLCIRSQYYFEIASRIEAFRRHRTGVGVVAAKGAPEETLIGSQYGSDHLLPIAMS